MKLTHYWFCPSNIPSSPHARSKLLSRVSVTAATMDDLLRPSVRQLTAAYSYMPPCLIYRALMNNGRAKVSSNLKQTKKCRTTLYMLVDISNCDSYQKISSNFQMFPSSYSITPPARFKYGQGPIQGRKRYPPSLDVNVAASKYVTFYLLAIKLSKRPKSSADLVRPYQLDSSFARANAPGAQYEANTNADDAPACARAGGSTSDSNGQEEGNTTPKGTHRPKPRPTFVRKLIRT